MTVKHLPAIAALPIADIAVGTRLRPVLEVQVTVLKHLIGEAGFTVPVLVRKKKQGFVLIDGAHRLAALREMAAEAIPVRVVECNDNEARAMEAGQNLGGSSMTALDDALFLAAYASAYETAHPETRRGVAGGLARQGIASEISSFADLIARTRRMTPRQVQKIVSAGRRISKAEAAALHRAEVPPTLKDILVIGTLTDPDERAAVVADYAEGRAKSARAALKARQPQSTPAARPEADLQRLRDAWARAGADARKRFVREHFDDLRSAIWHVTQTMPVEDAMRAEMTRRARETGEAGQ